MTDLLPEYRLGDLVLTSYPFAVEFGGSHGAPETREELVESMLADGDIVDVPGYGNREMSLVVYVDGADLADLAENEVTLRRECSKSRNLLTFDPGDGFGPASVFETFTASMVFVKNDSGEMAGMRRWELTIPAAPFARSADLTTVEALVAGTTTVSVDTCDATTGWTGTRGGESYSVGTSDGSVWVFELSTAEGFPPEVWTMTRTGTIDVSTTPYLTVVTRTLSSSTLVEAFAGASVSATQMAPLAIREIASSRVEYVWAVPAGVTSLDAITFRHTSVEDGRVWQGFHIYDISRTDVPPSETARQLTRIIETGGTERTPASIHVEAADGATALSTTVVHTSPEDGSGYSPPLRRWRDSGNLVTTDANTFSGGREPIHPNPFVAKVPTSALPEGGYELVAFLRTDTVGLHRIYWTAGTLFPPPNDTVRQGDVESSTLWDCTQALRWEWVSLGLVTLPTVRTQAGTVQIDILRDAGETAAVEIDEAWLFRVGDDCALSVVNVAAANLWLDSASVESSEPTVWMGDDRETAAHPGEGLFGMGHHVLHPDGTAAFVGTTGGDWPLLSAEFYRRWHSNAAE